MGKTNRKNSILKYENHSFYCLNCGKKGIPIWRNKGHLHEKNHRKALYCPHCRTTVNHIEINNMDDVIKFKNNFIRGAYKEEAIKSILYLKESIKEIL